MIKLSTKTLREILTLPLTIPDYQRIYCWEEQNVNCLLEDILNHFNRDSSPKAYLLGTIILHNNNGKYDIIDGQQRLITLAITLVELGKKIEPEGGGGLLKQSFESSASNDSIASNKYIIHEFCDKNLSREKQNELSEKIADNLVFSVLELKDANIDLAYTFFSNQNSRGVALTDYDLLKAHHLRYIPQTNEEEATNAAEEWNMMLHRGRQNDSGVDAEHVRTLDTYLYRLRRWMKKGECYDDNVKYRIKQEYEAAPIIEGIPPFGEKFYFNEPIQGGTHFFEYVKRHLLMSQRFIEAIRKSGIHTLMANGSFQYYRDVIEALLFAYYLKFDQFYLSDALAVIMRIILQHRYLNSHARKSSIVRYARDTEIVLAIDQATSPTFFLADAYNKTKNMYLSGEFTNDKPNVQQKMMDYAKQINKNIAEDISIKSFKELNEYANY